MPDTCTFYEEAKQHCLDNGVTILKTRQVKDKVYYDKICQVSPDQVDDIDVLINEILCIRTALLDLNKAWVNPMKYDPDEAIILNRLYEADAIAFLCRVAWESKLAGNFDLYNRLIESNGTKDFITMMQVTSQEDFRGLKSGTSMAAVVENVMLSDIVRLYDKEIVADMLADHKGFVFDNKESLNDISKIISNIGITVENNKNYLSEHVDVILTDPLFCEPRDRNSANFLWFIKFERSFKESEDEGNRIAAAELDKKDCVILDIPKNTKKDLHPVGEVVGFQQIKMIKALR